MPPPLAMPGPSIFEVEGDGVFSWRERFLAPFARKSLDRQQIVDEHRLAFEQIEAVATEVTAIRVQHALCASLGNLHIRGDLVGLG